MSALKIRSAVLTLAAAAAAGCSSSPKGELALAVQTDLSAPKDLDAIELQIRSGGALLPTERFLIGPGETALPATQGLLASESEPSREIQVRVRAFRGDALRIEHTVTTTVPGDRAATLWLPLSFLCSSPGDGGAPVSCPETETCVAGACRSRVVDSSLLPDYAEAEIFGDGCFDVARCFDGAVPAEDLQIDGCSIAADGEVNVALASEGEGFCGASGCYVPVDAESDPGWAVDKPTGRLKLPPAVCGEAAPSRLASPRVVTARVSASCPKKTRSRPVCRTAPDPSLPVAIAAWQRSPVSLTVSAGDQEVLWTEQGTPPGEGGAVADGAVKAVALAGGPTRRLAEGQAAPRDLALDAEEKLLFWTNRGLADGAGEVRRLDLVSPGAKDVAPFGMLSSPEGISVRGDRVFWSELPSRGGAGGGLFEDSVQAVQGTPRPPPRFRGDSPYRVATADNVVCWTDLGKGDLGAVWCATAGGVPIAMGTMESTPVALVIDAGGETPGVYWVDFGALAGRGEAEIPGQLIWSALDGSRRAALFSGPPGPYGVAVDEARVYWTNRLEGKVHALSKGAAPGAAPDTLASGQRNPGALAASGRVLYWINEGAPGRGDGAVVRRAIP